MKTNYVKKRVSDTLLTLMKTKNISDISISLLVKRSEIARSSFYRNFLMIDSVVDYLIKNILYKIHDETKLANLDFENYILEFFSKALNYKEQLGVLVMQKFDHKILNEINQITYNSIIALNVLDNYYQPYYFAGASASIFIAWIKARCKDSPEYVAKIFMKCLNGGYMQI